ncbi:hypothetical protein ACLOAU_04195 [Niabella sp. CJ426]|uniref:hypothetical protein n=1 Tax=Niabella sp. CJ426 TaxID=3393740 RepID=UPI003CFEF6C2
MGHFKMIKIASLLIVMSACNSNTSLKPYSDESEKQIFCYETIKEDLNRLINYKTVLANSTYYNIDKEGGSLLLKENKELKEQFNEFFDQNIEVEPFLIKTKNNRILLLIGKAAGATGIGVNYWNYKGYSIDVGSPILDFSSLLKTPYSLYENDKDEVHYIEVDDNYPRPAGGEDINLKYVPVLLRVFNGRAKVLEIETKCKTNN